VLAETADAMESVRISAGKFVATYMHDAVNRVALFNSTARPPGKSNCPHRLGHGDFRQVQGDRTLHRLLLVSRGRHDAAPRPRERKNHDLG